MGFSRVFIINPPNPTGNVSSKDAMGGFGQLDPAGAPPAPALDLPYQAAYLRQAGTPVSVVEAGALRLTEAPARQKNLINRRGILKNANVAAAPCRLAMAVADWGCHVTAEGLLRVARWHFTRTLVLRPRTSCP